MLSKDKIYTEEEIRVVLDRLIVKSNDRLNESFKEIMMFGKTKVKIDGK